MAGEAVAENLGGASGYLGQILPADPQTLRRDGTFQFSLYVELTDDQVRKIEEHRNHTDGSFNLRLGLRFDGTDREGKPVWNTGSLSNVRVGREDWLSLLRQVSYRKLVVAELEVPDAASQPELATALDFCQQAQARFGTDCYRGTEP